MRNLRLNKIIHLKIYLEIKQESKHFTSIHIPVKLYVGWVKKNDIGTTFNIL